MMRVLSICLAAIASIALALGILAGVANRNVVDGNRFADHADSIRRNPAVAEQVGTKITNAVLTANPNLGAVRPLIGAASDSLAQGSAISPIVRTAARALHRHVTNRDSGDISLRLVDVGAAVVGVAAALGPQSVRGIPAGLQVTLSRISDHSAWSGVIQTARFAGLASWLLPLIALLLLAAGLFIDRDHHRAIVRAGWSVVIAGGAVVGLAVVGVIVAGRYDDQTLHGALVGATLREAAGLLWWPAGVTVTAGALLIAGATARLPGFQSANLAAQLWQRAVRRPQKRPAQVARGLALTAVGVVALLRPTLLLAIAGAALGVILLITGLGEIAAAAGARRRSRTGRPETATARRWTAAVILGMAAVLVIGLIGFEAAPANRTVSAFASDDEACNGHVELCSRPYDQVTFPATHNSMAVADEPGWFLPEQSTGVMGQLNAGVRGFLIDSYYGQQTKQFGTVATSPDNFESALADAKASYGADAVTNAIRLHKALLSTPTGPKQPYLCHGFCEFGATPWQPLMTDVRGWVEANPREVLTFIIQDYVSPADTNKVFSQAGLLPYVYTPQAGKPWPTLGSMIDSGKRIVVMMENHGGGATYPWLMQAFDWTQDTPYANRTISALSCRLQRGAADHPLFLVNYWLNNFRTLFTDAQRLNRADQIDPYLKKCEAERHTRANFVAVNFFAQGDVFQAVDILNGFT